MFSKVLKIFCSLASSSSLLKLDCGLLSKKKYLGWWASRRRAVSFLRCSMVDIV